MLNVQEANKKAKSRFLNAGVTAGFTMGLDLS
jgi:hypothetical protein